MRVEGLSPGGRLDEDVEKRLAALADGEDEEVNALFDEDQALRDKYSTITLEYRGTSPIRKRLPLGPYSRHMPRALWWSYGGGRFLMSEVPL